MRLRLQGKTVAILTTEAIVWYVYHEDILDTPIDGVTTSLYDYLQYAVAPEEYNVMVKNVN